MRARDNPFGTARLEALPLRGIQLSEILPLLRAHRLRGSILGPRGSGKTRFLEALEGELNRSGVKTMRVTFTDSSTLFYRLTALLRLLGTDCVVLLDGEDQLTVGERFFLSLRRRERIITTSHRGSVFRPLVQMGTSPELLSELVHTLVPSEHAANLDLPALFYRHRGNLRTALLELYDVFGRTQPSSETSISSPSSSTTSSDSSSAPSSS